MDYLKELQECLGGRIKPRQHSNSNFKQRSFRELTIPKYKQFKIEVGDYGPQCAINIKITTGFVLSINNPDWLFLRSAMTVEGFSYPVYVSKEDAIIPVQANFKKCYQGIDAMLKKIGLSADESVFIYHYEVCFSLHSNRDLIPVLDNIIDLINNHPDVFRKTTRTKIVSKNIPDNLKALLPLLKKFSVSDDAEREELTEKMTKAQKAKLISDVDPFMKEINHFLDSFKDEPLTEEATLIGNLAELVSELKVNTEL